MWHSSTCYSVQFKPYNIVGNVYFIFLLHLKHMYYLLQSIISYFPQETWKLDYLLLSHLNLYMISRWKTLLRVFSGVNVDIYSCYECDIVSYILWCIVLNNLLWGALNKEINPIEKWVLRMCRFVMCSCLFVQILWLVVFQHYHSKVIQ